MLVAAMNPCPCGYLGDPVRACRCTPQEIARYRGRLSGPLRDRIDLVLEVPGVPAQALGGEEPAEPSEPIRSRVLAARRLQEARREESGVRVNAELHGRAVWRFCRPDAAGRRLLDAAVRSARAQRARLPPRAEGGPDIADLSGLEMPGAEQVAEALQYRVEDR